MRCELSIASLTPLSLLVGLISTVQADDQKPPLSPRLAAPLVVEAFPLPQIRLLDGPFRQAQERDKAYLLSLDVDRLLHTFRLNAGLPTDAQPLGGWEEPAGELRGHFAGHYLTACSLMYAATGDARFKTRVDELVAGLAACQQALGSSGYLSAYPETFIDRVEAGKPVWAPYYTLHKILAGLLDAFVETGNAQALEVARHFGDWVVERNGRLTDAQVQAMLANEHGGINEAMANLHALTGEQRYLETALRLNHDAVIDPASRGIDALTGLHANTQVPKFIGGARLYELTGDEALKAAALNFWSNVVHDRSYVIGGHSDGEHFSPKETLSQAFGPSTTETCNTYNMIKLTRHLFTWDPVVEYADYDERALINHILASQDPATGMMCYYVPLKPGSRKVYNTPLDSFWCCTGTGVENHARYGEGIYFHEGASALHVNLFIASVLDWSDAGITLKQETAYPDEQTSRLTFTCEKPTRLALKLRHPRWCQRGFTVSVNGEPVATSSQPGDWEVIDRTWKSGDTVHIDLPFALHIEGFQDNPARLAFLHGPLVLAAEIDPARPVPAMVGTPADVINACEPVPGKSSTFRVPAGLFRIAGVETLPEVILEPFFRIHENRPYTVYWDAYTPEGWQTFEASARAERERMRQLDARTIDVVSPGDEQRERDHALQGERTQAGPFQDRHWRHAVDGGFFAWSLNVDPATEQELWVTYWGDDVGNRVFDVLADSTTLATERLDRNQPGAFFVKKYPLPPALVAGKKEITARFQAHPGATAGGVFEARIVRAAKDGTPRPAP